jgi:transglutaminase-like putative cysteine protease
VPPVDASPGGDARRGTRKAQKTGGIQVPARYCTIVAAVAACAVTLGARAAVCAENARQVLTIDIQILPDFTVIETTHEETTPLAQTAVSGAAMARWSVSGNQTVEIVEAFTRKADGRKVPTDRKDFVTQAGAVSASMSFVDLKVQQVPFRDLGVGDTAVLTKKVTEKGHYIPKLYSREIVATSGPFRRSFEVTLRTPASLDIRHDEQLMSYQESLQGDQMVRRWSGSTAPGAVSDKNAANLAFSLPALRISTFADYDAIASAYYARAKEKAVVTPEIQALADEVTQDKRDTKEQARALYDWVTRNIRYVAVYFGSGRFVPNDSATILSRRFGDCKDAATLLSALLAAKGIASEHVLINALSTYRLAKTATLSAFNHVIVYIPALDRYVDPTVSFGNFDHLPMNDSGKPVVRVSDKGVTVARTPVWSVNDNVIEIDARMNTAANGLRSGRTTITSRGMFADLMRAYLAQIEARGQEQVLPALAQSRGIPGATVDIESPQWTEAREPFKITVKWSLPKPAAANESRFKIPPAMSPFIPVPELFFGVLGTAKPAFAASCQAGRAVYTLHVQLPDNVVTVKLPPAIKKSTPQFSYSEEWTHEGQDLRRRMEVVSTAKDPVCSPEQVDAVRTAYASIGTRTYPSVTSGGPGQVASRPSVLQQLFGTSPAASGAKPNTAGAENPTPRNPRDR